MSDNPSAINLLVYLAEFREFCSLTPQTLATGPLFHPFIERAKQR